MLAESRAREGRLNDALWLLAQITVAVKRADWKAVETLIDYIPCELETPDLDKYRRFVQRVREETLAGRPSGDARRNETAPSPEPDPPGAR